MVESAPSAKYLESLQVSKGMSSGVVRSLDGGENLRARHVLLAWHTGEEDADALCGELGRGTAVECNGNGP